MGVDELVFLFLQHLQQLLGWRLLVRGFFVRGMTMIVGLFWVLRLVDQFAQFFVELSQPVLDIGNVRVFLLIQFLGTHTYPTMRFNLIAMRILPILPTQHGPQLLILGLELIDNPVLKQRIGLIIPI